MSPSGLPLVCARASAGTSRKGPRSALGNDEPQMVTWQCEQLHAHFYDLLRDAQHLGGEKQQSAPGGKRCGPDISILNAGGESLAFIEVVRTHLSERAVAVAIALDLDQVIVDGLRFCQCNGAATPSVPPLAV